MLKSRFKFLQIEGGGSLCLLVDKVGFFVVVVVCLFVCLSIVKGILESLLGLVVEMLLRTQCTARSYSFLHMSPF